MTKQIQILTALLLLAGNAFADSFRVHYSIRGSGRDITVKRNHPQRPGARSWICFPAQS